MTATEVVDVVVAQHCEEVAFLWVLRAAAVSAPHYRITDLSKLDGRIEAHIDGLRLAGDAAWEICPQGLADSESGEVFALAVLAFERRMHTQEVLALTSGRPDLARPIVSALGWLPYDVVAPHIAPLVGEGAPTMRRMGIAALAVHRAGAGTSLSSAISEEDPALRARALRAIGELGRIDLLPITEFHQRSSNDEVRFSAAWSAAVLSTASGALEVLAAIAATDSRHGERALQTVMRRAQIGAAKGYCQRLIKDAGTIRLGALGIGALGDPTEIPWLVDQMDSPELARIAGESFATITGVDLAYQDLDGDAPAGLESGPTEDPADENVEMDPDQNLPWPDPKLIQKWWQSNRHSYQPGTRYLLGKPITIEWCKQVLRIGRQRQRAAAALELAMRQPGTPLFEVRAPGFRQKQLLGL